MHDLNVVFLFYFCNPSLHMKQLQAYSQALKDNAAKDVFMRWFKPGIRDSISALLGSEVRRNSPEALEVVRKAMLATLGEDGARLNPQLIQRLTYLGDAHALWFARSEMVAVLSQLHGEAKAVDKVQGLSPAFQGLISRSLVDACRLRR